MDKNRKIELTKRYQNAADSIVEKIKADPNVIAVILCGSLSYDQVWEKSDIDMTIIVRDQNLKNHSFCLVEDDINMEVHVETRSGFKRLLEGMDGGFFLHSYYSKGKLIYCTEDSFYEYFEDYKSYGRDDIALNVFFNTFDLLYYYKKSMKWLKVKEDRLYSQYYVLKAAEVIARMEVSISGEIPTREAIRKAMELNPSLIAPYYQDAMSHLYSEAELMQAIEGINYYMEKQLDIIKKPLLDYMSDGEMKTVTMIANYFHVEDHALPAILDYLADKGVIAKVSQTIRLTPKSRLAVEEIAYQYVTFS